MAKKKTMFYKKLHEFMKTNSDRSDFINDERYEMLIQEIEEAQLFQQNKKPLSSKQYRRLKRYDIHNINDTKKLIEKRQDNTKMRFFCKAGEVFEILESAHYRLGHKSTRAMENELKKKYCNITRQIINLYLALCEKCKSKKKTLKTNLEVPPIVSDCMNSRSQVDIVNMQANPDSEYRFILNYQDHLTKFTILRPLKSNSVEEVAYQLVDIFSLFGTPCILQFDYGREFAQNVIDHVAHLWPGVKIVHGNSNASNADQEIRDIVLVWMAENSSEKWSDGLRFIQSNKNRNLNSETKKSPYEAMFGKPHKMGLTNAKISSGMYVSLNTEEELEFRLKSATKIKKEENDIKSEFEFIESNTSNAEELVTIIGDICDVLEIKTEQDFKESEDEDLKPADLKLHEIPSTSAEAISCPVLPTPYKQGYIICHCKRYCLDNKCKCHSQNLKCNSKCHNKILCKNL